MPGEPKERVLERESTRVVRRVNSWARVAVAPGTRERLSRVPALRGRVVTCFIPGGLPIVVTTEAVRKYGASAAITMQQLHYRAGDDGWTVASLAQLSEWTGLSRQQVHRLVTKLRASGALEAREASDDPSDRTLAYRLGVSQSTDGVSRNRDATCIETETRGVSKPRTLPLDQRVEDQHKTPPNPPALALVPDAVLTHDAAVATSAPTFDDFWAVYPRRKAKEAARRAWAKAVKRVDPAVIVEGARRYAVECQGRDPKYVRHPATWLNGGCWEDEPDTPVGRTKHDRFKQMAEELGI